MSTSIKSALGKMGMRNGPMRDSRSRRHTVQ